MEKRYFAFWPTRLPHSLVVPQTNLYSNLEVSAQRYPDKTAIMAARIGSISARWLLTFWPTRR